MKVRVRVRVQVSERESERERVKVRDIRAMHGLQRALTSDPSSRAAGDPDTERP